jgi:hypothetical protein
MVFASAHHMILHYRNHQDDAHRIGVGSWDLVICKRISAAHTSPLFFFNELLQHGIYIEWAKWSPMCLRFCRTEKKELQDYFPMPSGVIFRKFDLFRLPSFTCVEI